MSQLPQALAAQFGPVESAAPDRHRRNAAVALVLRPPPGATDPPVLASDLLVIKRAESERDPWSGQMALPGGSLDAADAGLVAAAIRETLEETGLDLSAGPGGHVMGRIEPMRPLGVRLPVISIWPFVFRDAPGATARINSPEVAAVHWFPLEALIDKANRGTYPYDDRGQVRSFPCIRVEGRVIWGLTYRIVTRFLEVV